MTWGVVTESGDMTIAPGSPLALRVAAVERLAPGWAIDGITWVVSGGAKSWIAYIKRPGHFIAPSAMRSPAAAINEAIRVANKASQEPSTDG